MFFNKLRFAALLILSCFVFKLAEATPYEITDHMHQLASKVKVRTLSNGLRVVFYRRGVAPVFSGYIGVRVGGVDEVTGMTGLSHMLEHMAFKGTPTIGTKDFVKEKPLLDELELLMSKKDSAAGLSASEKTRLAQVEGELKNLWIMSEFNLAYTRRGGSRINARTMKEVTEYFEDLPRNQFEFWNWMESERIYHPVMHQFYQERDVVLEERRFRYEDSPQGKLYELLLAAAYQKHPYRNPVIGYREDLNRLSAQAAAALHEKYYVPGNMVIGLVGDVDPDRDMALLERYFGRIPAGPVPQLPQIVEPEQQGERTVELKLNVNPDILIAYHKTQYPHQDDPAIGVMTHILQGTNIAPLHRKLVEEMKVAVSVSADEEPGQAYPNLLVFGIEPKAPHGTQDALVAFDSVIEEFKRNGPTEHDLEVARKNLIVEQLASFKSNQDLAAGLASNLLIFGRWDASFDWLEKALTVSREDVIRVANTYLRPEHRTIGRIENKGGVN